MTGITADDIARSERVRAVTDNFFFWQGRRFIGLGPVLIVAAFTANAGLDERLVNGVLAAAIAVAMIASIRIGRRYREEFGNVRPIPGAHATRSRVKWLLVYPAMFASLALDILSHDRLPLFVSGFVWAVGIALYRRSTGGGRTHYLVLAACLAGLGLAPLATAITGRDLAAVMMLVLGAGYTASVLLDDDEMRDVLRGA